MIEVEVRQSAIERLGVFAVRPVAAGTLVREVTPERQADPGRGECRRGAAPGCFDLPREIQLGYRPLLAEWCVERHPEAVRPEDSGAR